MAVVDKQAYIVNVDRHGPVTFNIDHPRYTISKKTALGKGAYGVVSQATDTMTGDEVAIKRINPVFGSAEEAKRTLRELILLRGLRHDNIISIKDIMMIAPANYNSYESIYVVLDLMDTDMHKIIHKSPADAVNESHFQYFMYQIFKGLKYLHSANILHRDLKPSNLLLNTDSLLKICDFGFARIDTQGDQPMDTEGEYTEYVVTRWYRAPEVICDRKMYHKGVDMWSAGCILAEMLNRKVFLQGDDQVTQLALILNVVGTPTPAQIQSIMNANARHYVQNYRKVERRPFSELFPTASPAAIDLLEKLLLWDPNHRLTAGQALEHPFVQEFRDTREETAADAPAQPSDFEGRDMSIADARRRIFNEMLTYHPNLGKPIPGDMEPMQM